MAVQQDEAISGQEMSRSLRFSLSLIVDIKSISTLQADIIQALADGQDLLIDTSAVAESDLTLIQLILSAWRSAATHNLSLSLAGPMPEPVLRMLERGGFIGPAPDTRRDFWLAA